MVQWLFYHIECEMGDILHFTRLYTSYARLGSEIRVVFVLIIPTQFRRTSIVTGWQDWNEESK